MKNGILKIACVCSVLVLTATAVTAQYTQTTQTGQAYIEIVNPTYEIPDTSQYWGNVSIKPDMYFTAFGSQYDLYENVFVPALEGYLYFINTTRSVTVYAAKGDFKARPGAGQTSVFSFKEDGTNGQKTLVLQWKNMGIVGGDSADYINFQVWMYENSGVIEMRFGPRNVKNGLWENNANGPTIGLLEMDASFSTIYNRYWLTGNSATPVVQKTGTFLQLNNVPAQGTVYRFTPNTATGIANAENKGNGFSIYPSLVQDGQPVWLQMPGNSNCTVKLYNAIGQLITTQIAQAPQTVLQLENLPAGTYILTAEQEGQVVYSSRVLKVD